MGIEQGPRSPEELEAMGIEPEKPAATTQAGHAYLRETEEMLPIDKDWKTPLISEQIGKVLKEQIDSYLKKGQRGGETREQIKQEREELGEHAPKKGLLGRKEEAHQERLERLDEQMGRAGEKEKNALGAVTRYAGDYRVIFGEDAVDPQQKEALRALLQGEIEEKLHSQTHGDLKGAAFDAATYRELFGTRFWTQQDESKMLEELKSRMEESPLFIASTASRYRVLSGDRPFWSPEEQKQWVDGLEKHIRDYSLYSVDSATVGNFADHRILTAPELRFTDKGIELTEKTK